MTNSAKVRGIMSVKVGLKLGNRLTKKSNDESIEFHDRTEPIANNMKLVLCILDSKSSALQVDEFTDIYILTFIK